MKKDARSNFLSNCVSPKENEKNSHFVFGMDISLAHVSDNYFQTAFVCFASFCRQNSHHGPKLDDRIQSEPESRYSEHHGC